MFKHLLVPTDGTEFSMATVRRAATFASDASARSDNARDALDLARAQSQNNVRLLPKLPQVPFVNPTGQATGLIVSAIA